MTPLTLTEKQELEQRYKVDEDYKKVLDDLGRLGEIHPLKGAEKKLQEDVTKERGKNFARISELENVERTDP